MAGFNRTFGESEGESEIDLTHVARVLGANAKVIAVVVVLVTAVVLLVSRSADSRYRATARIVADTTATSTASTDTDARRLATNVALLTTPDVLAAAARGLPGESPASLRDKVSSTVASDADVIAVTATDDSADAAAADANAVARAFLDRRAARARAANLRTRAALTAQLANVGKGPAASAQAAAIRTRLSELVVDAANAGSELQLAEAAQPPDGPYAPRPLRNAVMAFFVAFFLAALAVLARDRLRTQPSGARELERTLGVPLIAALPAGGSGSRFEALARRLGGPAGDTRPGSPGPSGGLTANLRRARAARSARARAATADALRSVLGTVLLALPPGTRRVILVTSPARGQGSARVAAGLARALARAGQDTLAVSTDLGSSGLATALGVASSPGLAEALEPAQAGTGVRLRAVAVPDVDMLHVVPAGHASHDGVGLVRPGAVDAVFAALANARYDYVVVEAPALLAAPEAWQIARYADAAIVACPEHPSATEVAAARSALDALTVRVLGVVTTVPGSEPEPAEPATAVAQPSTSAPPVEDPGPLAEAAAAAANGQSAPAGEAQFVLECLRAAEGPLTFSQVREALGGPPPSHVRTHLRELLEGGDVVRAGSGRSGDPYVYGPRDR